MKKGYVYLIAIFFCLALLNKMCSTLFEDEETPKTMNLTPEELRIQDSILHAEDSIKHHLDSLIELEASYWVNGDYTDDLTGKPVYHEQLLSENTVFFDFPYDGGSQLKINVRKHPQYGKDVYIRITKGQFMNSVNGTKVKVRFDDGNVMTFNAVRNTTDDSDILFLQGYSRFVSALKKSRTCTIQVPFYQEGERTFKFKTQHFEWDH